MAHEYMYLTPVGEDTLLICDACGYSANRQIATFVKPSAEEEEGKPVEKVPTPGVTTIEELAGFLGVPKARTAKAVFVMATLSEGLEDVEEFVFAVVRGDMELNETKLANAVRAKALRPAEEAEIRAVGAEPGYGSPVGLRDILVVVDDAIPTSPNLVAGANEPDHHLLNVNYGRDYQADVVADIAVAEHGSACPNCSNPMAAQRGVEVGNIFKLGTRYCDAMGATFLDQEGQSRSIVMGSYGIGTGRLLASVAEEHNDEYGLVWPISVAPYHVHLVTLGAPGTEPREVAERLYEEMKSAGIEVLFDDREESPGVKFMDADLIGMPLRLTVSKRSLGKEGVEFKLRPSKERNVVPLEQTISRVKEQIAALQEEIDGNVVEIAFRT
jgi:prolyl-tRNA synthetase